MGEEEIAQGLKMVVEEKEDEVKSFKDLEVCNELVDKIQAEAAIPHALEGKDLIGLAQTGSGKTGAFALPILQEAPQAFFACSVLSSTRELAIQIAEHFGALRSSMGVKVCRSVADSQAYNFLCNTTFAKVSPEQ